VIRDPGAEPLEVGAEHALLLAEVAEAVHGPASLSERLERVVQLVRGLTGAAAAAYVETAGGSPSVEALAGGMDHELVESLSELTLAARRRGDLPREGAVRVDDLDRHPGWSRRGLRSAGITSWLSMPVVSRDGVEYGAIVVADPEIDAFDEHTEMVVEAIAAHLTVALENQAALDKLAELQAAQREVVHQLQDAVRPPTPEADAVELGVHYLSADEEAPTGGDLYDWLVLPGGDLFVTVVDVMGKGVSATKEALSVTHAVRLLVLEGCPLGDVVRRADELITAQSPDLVATVIVARYSATDGRVELAGGGHPPALLLRSSGEAEFVAAPGVPIGWPGAGSSAVVERTLDRADTLVLYTDGLIEARRDVLLGLERLAEAGVETARYPAAAMARVLVDRALDGAARRDDSLALVLRRRVPPPPSSSPPLRRFEYHLSRPASVSLARHALRDWLEHLTLDPPEVADLLLVASELCANALKHAKGAVVLRSWPDGNDVIVEVEDEGAGFVPPSRYIDELPDPEADSGRGLFLIEALTDNLEVRRDDERTAVRARKHAVLPSRS
jgi:serine phosphatase RsbU (regulator of sigma subunit)/anti-sigma regulatory factor (Ser/Thr protein kinase)